MKASKVWYQGSSYGDDLNEKISDIIHIYHPMDHFKRNFSEHWDDIRDDPWNDLYSEIISMLRKIAFEMIHVMIYMDDLWDHLHKKILDIIPWMLPWIRLSNLSAMKCAVYVVGETKHASDILSRRICVPRTSVVAQKLKTQKNNIQCILHGCFLFCELYATYRILMLNYTIIAKQAPISYFDKPFKKKKWQNVADACGLCRCHFPPFDQCVGRTIRVLSKYNILFVFSLFIFFTK